MRITSYQHYFNDSKNGEVYVSPITTQDIDTYMGDLDPDRLAELSYIGSRVISVSDVVLEDMRR